MTIIEYTEFIVKNLVDNPDMVKVDMFETEGEEPIIEIIVHSDDMGKVIGKNGNVATSIRTLVQAFAFINKMSKVKINIDSF